MSLEKKEFPDIYCLNYANIERRHEMKTIFNNFNGINVIWSDGVRINDSRIPPHIDNNKKRTWSMCYGHLDMIHKFVNNSNKEHAIFCEDDLLIRNDFMKQVPKLVEISNEKGLDIILMGYLCENKIDEYTNFPEICVSKTDFPFKVLDYIGMESVWGAQMYLLSRKQGQILLDKYYTDYAMKTLLTSNMTPFNPDWTITKEGKHSLIYPPIAIENGKTTYNDYGQMRARNACYDFCYKKELFDYNNI